MKALTSSGNLVSGKNQPSSTLRWRFYVVLLILTIAIFASFRLSIPSAAVKRIPLSRFPRTLGNWKCVSEQRLADEVMNILKVDDYFMGTYKNSRGELIDLYIGYFKTQQEGKQVHSPRQCLPGAGWFRIKHMEVPLPLKVSQTITSANASVNVDLMEKGTQKELYVWWYQGRGRVYANEYLNKLYLMWDSVARGRTDGALVRINLPYRHSLAATLQEAMQFIKTIFPQIPNYVPN